MSEEKTIISEAELEAVAGGVTRDLIAAYACIRGEYGNGNDRIVNLRRAGYSDADINSIQNLVNHTLWR